jgi:alkanesulfonate monooxygenase SsuD/methylene tetrahydromethanopterin reductase-like flavin-dependent oxidoreductase (luciferase family)
MFSGERFSYRGRHYLLEDAIGLPRPVAGRIPIHLGGAGPKLTMPLVARHADWWNCPASAVERLGELRPLAGRARIAVQHSIGLAPSSAERAAVDAVTRARFGSWGGVVTGTPDEVAAALFAEASAGVELFVLQFHDYATRQSLELFAREVVPAVGEAVGGLRQAGQIS